MNSSHDAPGRFASLRGREKTDGRQSRTAAERKKALPGLWLRISPFVKYSNGGCSGFEPDFLFIYSANNFSNRIFIRYSVFPELFRIPPYYITLCAVYQAPHGVFLRNKADNLPQALHMRRRGDKIKDDALRFNICLNGGHRPVVIYKRRDVYAFT